MARHVLLLVLLLSTSTLAEPLPRLAVLELRSGPDNAALASAVNGVLANELQRLGVFDVTTADQVRALLSFERQKMLLGVESSPETAARLAEQLQARYLLSGEVNRLKERGGGTTLSLQLVLLDAQEGRRVGSELLNARTEGELVSKVPATTLTLCSRVLQGRTGTLYVASGETGAAVKVDGVLRGTTPLPGRLELPAGPHLVQLEKEGFVADAREVRIRPGEHLEVQASLVPSPDFVAQYEARASRTRLGAWLVTGVAAVGLVGAGYFQVRALQLYGTPQAAGSFAFHQAQVNAGVELDETGDHRAEALRLRSDIQSAQRFVWIGGGVGAAAAVTATVLFLVGEPPGRYAHFGLMSAGVTPLPGGGLAGVTLGF